MDGPPRPLPCRPCRPPCSPRPPLRQLPRAEASGQLDADARRLAHAVVNRAVLGHRGERGPPRSARALAARTLGELTRLTADLTPPSGQPIRLYPGRAVTAILARERREGRWVVPDALAVTAILGDVLLDLRGAVLQSQRVTIHATVLGGQIRLIAPAGVIVEMAGRSLLGIRSIRGRGAAGASPGAAVIEVRTLALGGAVKVVTPRRPRWRGRQRPR